LERRRRNGCSGKADAHAPEFSNGTGMVRIAALLLGFLIAIIKT